MAGFVQCECVGVGVAGNFPFRYRPGLLLDGPDGFLIGQVHENPWAIPLQLKRFRMASELEFLQPFHCGRIDDCQRSTGAVAVAYINAPR